jgi:hypothetical protein
MLTFNRFATVFVTVVVAKVLVIATKRISLETVKNQQLPPKPFLLYSGNQE